MKLSSLKKTKHLFLIFSLLILFTFQSLDNIEHSIFVIFWTIFLFSITLYIFDKFKKIDTIKILIFSPFIGIFLYIFSLFTYQNLNIENWINYKYVSIYGVEEFYDSENVESYKNEIFEINDERVEKEINFLNKKNKNIEFSKEKFLYWETAFANGFKTSYISEYTNLESFKKKIIVIFKIGPIFILETIIISSIPIAILMIFPFILVITREKLFLNFMLFIKRIFTKESSLNKKSIN